MGMQVSSLSFGNVIASAAPQELPQEKRPPLPGGTSSSVRKTEAALLGLGKSRTPELQQTTSELERISIALNRRLKFEIDHESKQILVKVIDNETDKVIKVIPPEELQRLHSKIRETFGFLFDRMV